MTTLLNPAPVSAATIRSVEAKIDAIEAVRPAPTVSSRYGFISSRAIVDQLQSLGFVPRSIQLAKARKPDRMGFQKHIVRFRHEGLLPAVGDRFPEVLLVNSHDGSSSTQGMLGVFELVCSNGMISGNIEDAFRLTHRIANVDAIADRMLRLVEGAGRMVDFIKRMQGQIVPQARINDFVFAAAQLRFDDPNDRKLAALQSVRRSEDASNDAWKVFNRVQENLTQGARGTGIRRITGADRDLKINRELWNLAETMLLN